MMTADTPDSYRRLISVPAPIESGFFWYFLSMDQPRGRNGSIDVLRFIAAVGIVWFHAHAPGSGLAYSGLTAFLVLTVAFSVTTGHDRTFGEFALARYDRLVRPWLVWGAIYLLAKLAKIAVEGGAPSEEFHSLMLLTGPSLHLWFLPYAMVASLVAFAVARLHRGVWLALALAALALPAMWELRKLVSGPPFLEWANGVAAVATGLAIGLTLRDDCRLLPLVAALVAGLAVAHWLHDCPTHVTAVWALGSAAAIGALSIHWPANEMTRWLAGMAMPLYLLHPAALALTARVVDIPGAGSAILAIAASIAVGALLDRGRLGRVLF